MQVQSEAIAEIAYDPAKARLFVRFNSGRAYAYKRVPPFVHRDFLAAESKGRFFQTRIRDRFPYERLGRR